MPSHEAVQLDFSGGELSPYARGKQNNAAYQRGLRTAKNFIATLDGFLMNRAGTRFVAEAKDSTTTPVLLSFMFSDSQTFLLEVGDKYIRVYQSSVFVVEVAAPWAIADVPWLVWKQDGDVITFTCVNQATGTEYAPYEVARISNTNWTVTAVSFSPRACFAPLFHFDANKASATDIPPRGAQSWDPAHTYLAGDYAIADEIGADAIATGCAFMATKTTINDKPGVAGTTADIWVLAIDASRPAAAWAWALTVIWKDAQGVVQETLPATYGEFQVIVGTDRPVGLTWTAPGIQPFAYTVIGYRIYRGRKGVYGLVGVATETATTFVDNAAAPDFGTQPPRGTDPFLYATGSNTSADSYPAVVSNHEQRELYARSRKKPQDIWGSAIGKPRVFDLNTPVQDSDAFDFRLRTNMLEDVRWMLPLRHLLIGTGSGVTNMYGPSGPITPSNVITRKAYNEGVAYLRPLAIDLVGLFYTTRGRVRDLAFDWRVDNYAGRDVSQIARHLFENHTIVDWAYSQSPWSIVWAVRDDGILLSMTYAAGGAEAWARHTTGDSFARFERVAVVTETDPISGAVEDAVYLLVKRVINGQTKRYIERMSSRILPMVVPRDVTNTVYDANGQPTGDEAADVRRCNFLDCALQWDGRNTSTVTIGVSGQQTWVGGDQVTLIASGVDASSPLGAAGFNSMAIGDVLVLDPDGEALSFTLKAITSATSAVFTADEGVSDVVTDGDYDTHGMKLALGTRFWGWGPLKLSGYGHLAGQTVNALVDGAVAGPFVVAFDGTITLGAPGVIVQAGLGYTSDMELLDLAADGVRMNVKTVQKMAFEVVNTRGLLVGETFDLPPASRGKTTPQLTEPPQMKVADGNKVPPLYTGQVQVTTWSGWNLGARACMRQSDPLPCTVVAVVREVTVGGR